LIRIAVSLDDDNCIKYLNLLGHADSGLRGNDIVCAAATVLSRTFIQVLVNENGIDATATTDKEGHLEIRLHNIDDNRREWFRGISDFCMHGIVRLAAEYPENITIE
jgi:hypothetical protein